MCLTSGNTDSPVYAVYGTAMASPYPFSFRLRKCTSAPELWFDVVSEPPLASGWDAGVPRFDGRERSLGSDMVDAVFEADGCLIARFADLADFFIWRERIVCHLHDGRYAFAVEIWLLGTVMSLWLERRGITTMHAAAVEIDGRGAAFLATNKGGKSTLAAAMLQHGARLLTDDVLPLEEVGGRIVGRSGYPQMRFWPEQARALLGNDDGLARVQPGSPKLRVPVGPPGFGAFYPEAVPVAALYLPERSTRETVVIESVPMAEALVSLVRHSFLAGVMEALELAPARFRTFATLVRQAPVRKLRYPSGLDRLAEVCAAVRSDLEQLVDTP